MKNKVNNVKPQQKPKQKKYRLIVSEKQLRLIANCLEDISRFASGQPELHYTVQTMLKEAGLPFISDCNDIVQEHLEEVTKTILGNKTYGYNGTEFIGNTYQIYRTILYKLALDNNWNNVYSSPPLPSGTLGSVEIEVVE
jgi:hypothetical protein